MKHISKIKTVIIEIEKEVDFKNIEMQTIWPYLYLLAQAPDICILNLLAYVSRTREAIPSYSHYIIAFQNLYKKLRTILTSNDIQGYIRVTSHSKLITF